MITTIYHKANGFTVQFYACKYCRFHMTSLKIQTTKLSIPPRFYFHDVLEQLKTNFHTNFRFKRVLEVGQESCHVGLKMTYFREFCYLNSLCIRKVLLQC